MPEVIIILAIAALAAVVLILRKGRTEHSPTPGDMAAFMPTRPIGPSLTVPDWDGYTGIQMALCIALDDKNVFPAILAGSVPPVSVTKTFSSASRERNAVSIELYAGLDGKMEACRFVARADVGPLAVAEEEVEVTFSVDSAGAIEATAQQKGIPVPVSMEDVHIAALPTGSLD